MVETALGHYSSRLVAEWSLPDGFDADEVSARMPDAPEAWSDGGLVLDSVTGVSAAGALLFAHQSEHCLSCRRWGHVDHVLLDHVLHSCRGLCLSLGLYRQYKGLSCDGDLLVLIRRMLDLRGRGTVRITKAKGHADEAVVLDGRVRDLDRLGNNAADEAADFGRRRVRPAVIDACRHLSGFVDGGILLFLICIGSSLAFPGPLLIIMVTVEQHLILWCGLLVLCL